MEFRWEARVWYRLGMGLIIMQDWDDLVGTFKYAILMNYVGRKWLVFKN